MTQDELVSYCYNHKRQYIIDSGDDIDNAIEGFECLIELVEDGTISSMEELAKYGMKY
jgi:hypothetical protein